MRQRLLICAGLGASLAFGLAQGLAPALAQQHEHGHGMPQGGSHSMGGAAMAMPEMSIADGAVLSEAEVPDSVSIRFDHAMTLDRVILTTLAGETIALQPDGGGMQWTAPLPALQPDEYRLDWRARGADGHVMSGGISFAVE